MTISACCTRPHLGKKGPAPGMSRRRFSAALASAMGLLLVDWPAGKALGAEDAAAPAVPQSYPLFDEAVSRVLPATGFQSRIAMKDSLLKLVEHGVIDRDKLLALYGADRPLTAELAAALDKPSDRKILLNGDNSTDYVNLLWPVGLATRMAGNAESPINGESLFDFASTGGWTIGQAPNGGAYFNKFPIVKLTKRQEELVIQIAESIYRPCCNNSTFFQDCNHGSALLGALQLGASQGLSEDELYREALAFNSFWFPAQYIRTALLFKIAHNTEWPNVDPRVVLGFDYSAIGPWLENVAAVVDQVPDLIPPEPEGGAGCGL